VTITCILFWLAVMQAAMGLVTAAGWDGEIAWPSAAVLALARGDRGDRDRWRICA
jgi:hypothetical protein